MSNNSVNKCYVPKLRFKGFENNYNKKTINDCFVILNGLSGLKAENFKYGNDKYIPYKTVFNNWFINNNELEFFEKGTKKQNEVKKNDILITSSSETLNEIGYSSIYLDNEKAYLNSFCFILRNISKEVNSQYFNWLMKNKHYRKLIVNEGQGSTRYNLQKKQFKNIVFNFPLLEEQEKISKFLNLLDKQISLLENKLKLTELKMKNFIKQSNIENSKLKIKDISIVIDGFPFKQTSYVKEGIPIYTISNIGDNKFIDTIEYKYTNIEIDSKYQLNKGDIFASLTGEKGFKSLLYQNENKNYINQRTIKIEIKNNYSPELLQFWCFKNKRKISLLATGSQKNISKKDVENFLVPKCTKRNINLSKIFFNYIKNVQLIQDKLHVLNKRKTFFLKNLFI